MRKGTRSKDASRDSKDKDPRGLRNAEVVTLLEQPNRDTSGLEKGTEYQEQSTKDSPPVSLGQRAFDTSRSGNTDKERTEPRQYDTILTERMVETTSE